MTEQPFERDQEVLGDVAVALHVAAIHRDLADLVGRGLDDLAEVAQDRDAFVALVEDLHGAVEDRLLAVGRRRRAQDRDERADHHLPPRASVAEDLVARRARQARGRVGRLAGVQDVQAAEAAERDDLATERADEVDVVGLEVAEHEWHDAHPA